MRGEHYANLLARMEHEGAFTYENRFAQIMTGIGFAESDWDRPLSPAQRRPAQPAGLAKALLSEPDLLLLDEPTNHLDIDALRWLDGFLARWPRHADRHLARPLLPRQGGDAHLAHRATAACAPTAATTASSSSSAPPTSLRQQQASRRSRSTSPRRRRSSAATGPGQRAARPRAALKQASHAWSASTRRTKEKRLASASASSAAQRRRRAARRRT